MYGKKNKISLKLFINKYVEDNLKNKNYNINDILQIASLILNIDKNMLFIDMDNIVLDEIEGKNLTKNLNMLYLEHIPLQYITKKQPFYNEEYFVNNSVLIPRQDTEILVEKAIYYIEKYNLKKMIDMCTGSGCIGISILKNSNLNFAYLVDISKSALEVARKNVALNNLESKTKIFNSNLFKKLIEEKITGIDIIVSNPPYIPTKDIKTLNEDVKHEPLLALDGGEDGMKYYVEILNEAKLVLKNNGLLIFEIGYDELKKITDLIKNTKEYEMLESVKDLAGNDRVVVCRFHQI